MQDNFIVCSKCGTKNTEGSKFCFKCGSPLQNDDNVVNIQLGGHNDNQAVHRNVDDGNSVNMNNVGVTVGETNVQNSQTTSSAPVSKFNFFSYLLGAVIKPFDSFKKEESNLGNIKNVSILAIIVVVAATIINLFRTMLSVVRVKSYFGDEVEWVWDNLGNIEYAKLIFQNILVYVIILIAVAGVYYLAGLVLKKDANFVKLLGAATTAFIPYVLASSIVAPLVSLMSGTIGAFITIIGLIYAMVILIELINDLIVIENKNVRIYYHLICLSILIVGGGYIAYRIILGSLADDMSSLF